MPVQATTAPVRRWRGRTLLAAGATVVLATVSTAAGAAPAVADPELTGADVDRAVYEAVGNGTGEFFVYLRESADLSGAAEFTERTDRAEHVFEQLTTVAEASQADLRATLAARDVEYTPYWVVNALLVTGDRALVDELAARPDVARIEPNRRIEVPEPAVSPEYEVNAVEWGVEYIGAPKVWEAFGVAGQKIVVASIDTGVQWDHPALVNQYRGTATGGHDYNWFDPAGICPSPAPCDNNSHGTHVTGTMVGDDGAGNQIGVAPKAQWIAAKGCESSFCSQASLLASGQWMLAPTDLNGNNPRPAMAPHVVNNSWGGGHGDVWYQPVIQAWVQAGIFPSFAAGNSGPACNTANSPGDNIPAYAAGAHDVTGAIASFSSRGYSGVDNTTIKPNLAAPGVNVRSSVPTNSYASFNGTSMAAPHVSGTVALIWSKSPVSVGNVAFTIRLLDYTAVDVADLQCGGTPGDNNVYGEGRLNAYDAVWLAP